MITEETLFLETRNYLKCKLLRLLVQVDAPCKNSFFLFIEFVTWLYRTVIKKISCTQT